SLPSADNRPHDADEAARQEVTVIHGPHTVKVRVALPPRLQTEHNSPTVTTLALNCEQVLAALVVMKSPEHLRDGLRVEIDGEGPSWVAVCDPMGGHRSRRADRAPGRCRAGVCPCDPRCRTVRGLLCWRRGVPDTHIHIVAGRNDLLAIGTERHAGD